MAIHTGIYMYPPTRLTLGHSCGQYYQFIEQSSNFDFGIAGQQLFLQKPYTSVVIIFTGAIALIELKPSDAKSVKTHSRKDSTPNELGFDTGLEFCVENIQILFL